MEAIAEQVAFAIIDAPLEQINLAEWLFTLKSEEYRQCSKAHIAAGTSLTHDGKRMSINVEKVSGNLMIQHYVEEIGARDHCRVRSVSDSFSAMGQTKLGVVWELRVKKLTDESCEFSNRVTILMTKEFAALLKDANIPDLDALNASISDNVEAHNKQETPLFAKNIEQKALNKTWN